MYLNLSADLRKVRAVTVSLSSLEKFEIHMIYVQSSLIFFKKFQNTNDSCTIKKKLIYIPSKKIIYIRPLSLI